MIKSIITMAIGYGLFATIVNVSWALYIAVIMFSVGLLPMLREYQWSKRQQMRAEMAVYSIYRALAWAALGAIICFVISIIFLVINSI